ncbi:MAG: hypothetical protein FWD05_08260 [Oscillospiraceae bacterium]|nr:hypothetical protein [Oscillospiraceae bacterium]
MLIRSFGTSPGIYAIRDNYRELWDVYKEKTDFIVKEIVKIPDEDFITELNKAHPTFFLALFEITDCALRVQEQFLQDFKQKSRGPIGNQLIHRVGDSTSEK